MKEARTSVIDHTPEAIQEAIDSAKSALPDISHIREIIVANEEKGSKAETKLSYADTKLPFSLVRTQIPGAAPVYSLLTNYYLSKPSEEDPNALKLRLVLQINLEKELEDIYTPRIFRIWGSKEKPLASVSGEALSFYEQYFCINAPAVIKSKKLDEKGEEIEKRYQDLPLMPEDFEGWLIDHENEPVENIGGLASYAYSGLSKLTAAVGLERVDKLSREEMEELALILRKRCSVALAHIRALHDFHQRYFQASRSDDFALVKLVHRQYTPRNTVYDPNKDVVHIQNFDSAAVLPLSVANSQKVVADLHYAPPEMTTQAVQQTDYYALAAIIAQTLSASEEVLSAKQKESDKLSSDEAYRSDHLKLLNAVARVPYEFKFDELKTWLMNREQKALFDNLLIEIKRLGAQELAQRASSLSEIYKCIEQIQLELLRHEMSYYFSSEQMGVILQTIKRCKISQGVQLASKPFVELLANLIELEFSNLAFIKDILVTHKILCTQVVDHMRAGTLRNEIAGFHSLLVPETVGRPVVSLYTQSVRTKPFMQEKRNEVATNETAMDGLYLELQQEAVDLDSELNPGNIGYNKGEGRGNERAKIIRQEILPRIQKRQQIPKEIGDRVAGNIGLRGAGKKLFNTIGIGWAVDGILIDMDEPSRTKTLVKKYNSCLKKRYIVDYTFSPSNPRHMVRVLK